MAIPLAASSAGCERSVYYILRGQYTAALEQLDGAAAAGGSPAAVENLRGLAVMLEGDTARAIGSFDRALELDPALDEARLNRAVARLRIGELEDARPDLETIWKRKDSPLRASAAYHLGIVLDRLGRPADAEAWLVRAMGLDPKLDASLLYIGLLRERRGDLQGAGRAYLDYLETHPKSVMAMLRFGLSAQRAGRPKVAQEWLARVVATAPESAEALEARKFLVLWE